MGLDMYLTAHRYLSEHIDEEKLISDNARAAFNAPGRVTHITAQIGYWRKANHIHAWFVKHCQGGVDECQSTYISKDKLKELLNVCKKVKKKHSLASELLPTQKGFFFGSTKYNEYYFKDIDDTIEIVEKALLIDERKWSIRYKSSW